jgi:hypothetical protein
MTKTISHDDSLKMLGLFSIATHHRKQMYSAEEVLYRMAGYRGDEGDGGHIGNAIYSRGEPTADDFYEALKREGFEIADKEAP